MFSSYLHVDLFMFVTGDRHNVRPVCGLHHHAGQVRTGDVEGSGAVLMRTLDTRPTDLLRGLVAEDALLRMDRETLLCFFFNFIFILLFIFIYIL